MGMNINTKVPTQNIPTRAAGNGLPPNSAPEAATEQPDIFQRAAGAVRGTLQAAVFTLPGAYTGYKMASGATQAGSYDVGERLRHSMGLEGLLAGGALGFALGGGVGAGVGAFVGGVGGMVTGDFQWSEAATRKLSDRVETALGKHANPSTVRDKAAYKVRGTMVGALAARQEAFAIGQQVGQGKILGLERGLANVSTVLGRDSSAGLAPLDGAPRSFLKQALGLPLGVASAAGATLAGGLAGTSRYGRLVHGMVASTALGVGATVTAALLGAGPVALALVGAALVGAPVAAMVTGAVSVFKDGENSLGDRFDQRKRNDQQHAPKFIDFGDPSRENVANQRQFRIEGFTAGLKNAPGEAFAAGSRVTDPILNTLGRWGSKVVETFKRLPEKFQGIKDAITNPEG